MFVESEDNFFLKVVPAKVIFTKNDKGEITTLTLHQGGREMPGKKIE